MSDIGGKCATTTDCKDWGYGFGGKGIKCFGDECGEPGPRDDGETCNLDEDCLNWDVEGKNIACYGGVCAELEPEPEPKGDDPKPKGDDPKPKGDDPGSFAKIKRYLIIAAVAIGLFAMIGVFIKVGMLMGLSKKILAIVSSISFIIACVIIVIVVIVTKPKEEETYDHRQPPTQSLASLSKFNSYRF